MNNEGDVKAIWRCSKGALKMFQMCSKGAKNSNLLSFTDACREASVTR